jgi:hypothetical protein
LAGAVALVVDSERVRSSWVSRARASAASEVTLGALVGRRPLGVVLVVRRLEVGSVDHLVERALQRRQPSLCPRPLDRH